MRDLTVEMVMDRIREVLPPHRISRNAEIPIPPSQPAGSAAARCRQAPDLRAFAQGFFCLVIGFGRSSASNPSKASPARSRITGCSRSPGLLLAGIGSSMLIAAIRRDIAFEVFAIGLITALSLAVTDIIFVIERSIPAVYLLDAVAESLFVTLWVFAIRDTRRARRLPADPAPPAIGSHHRTRGTDGPG
jgi:hypothetical protein